MPEPGTLYIVSTPIGNLGDFPPRAVDTLRAVAVILAEDTRHSRPLLERHDIRTPVESYHEHNEAAATTRAIERLTAGESVALIADAGTPLLSDPGARLVQAAAASDVPIVAVPGASALLAALVVSGMDTERFTFFGFLARKGRERADALDAVARLTHTAVLYEAPGRVGQTLADLAAHGAAERRASVSRELTKRFEETRRGTVAELARYYQADPPRGEVVIVVAGGPPVAPDENAARERARAMLAAGVAAREVAQTLIAEHGVSRNVAYRLAHEP